MTTTMEHIDKEIKRALLVCVPYLVIVFFLDNLDKFFFTIHSRFGNPLLVLYMFIATVVILALLLFMIVELKQSYSTYGYKALIPMVIYLIAMLNSFWSPVRISSEVFRSKVVYRAFRRERSGHAVMRLRQDSTLDIRYPEAFGMADWEYGEWRADGDTFFICYNRTIDTIAVKPDTLIRTASGLLIPVGIPADTLAVYKDRFFTIPRVRKR